MSDINRILAIGMLNRFAEDPEDFKAFLRTMYEVRYGNPVTDHMLGREHAAPDVIEQRIEALAKEQIEKLRRMAGVEVGDADSR